MVKLLKYDHKLQPGLTTEHQVARDAAISVSIPTPCILHTSGPLPHGQIQSNGQSFKLAQGGERVTRMYVCLHRPVKLQFTSNVGRKMSSSLSYERFEENCHN